MNLRDAKRTLKGLRLSPDQLRRLNEWLHTLVDRADHDKRKRPASERDSPKEKQVGQKTYRLQSVRCGKEKCRCASGALHGPYWYAYWSEGGRTRSQYVGKKLPGQKKRR